MPMSKRGDSGRRRGPIEDWPYAEPGLPRRKRRRLWPIVLATTVIAVAGVMPVACFAGLPLLPAFLLSAGTGALIGLLAYASSGREGLFEGILLVLEILGCFF